MLTSPKRAGNCRIGSVRVVQSYGSSTHGLLLCQVTRGTKDDDDGVLLELHGTIARISCQQHSFVRRIGRTRSLSAMN